VVSYRCSYCGIDDGRHIIGCPGVEREEQFWMLNRSCKDCGWAVPGEHRSTCPQHRLRRNAKKPEPEPAPVAPDTYVSPHSVDRETAARNFVRVPVFDYTEDMNGVQHAYLTSTNYEYPHQDWLDAREEYAKDPLAHPLDTVLMHVTETNPPPGPPIPVYKPAEFATRKQVGVHPTLVFTLLWMLVGLAPLLACLTSAYIFLAVL
jgi:hypothetical protein